MNLLLEHPPGPNPAAGTEGIVCSGERRHGIGNRWASYTDTCRAPIIDNMWRSWTREP